MEQLKELILLGPSGIAVIAIGAAAFMYRANQKAAADLVAEMKTHQTAFLELVEKQIQNQVQISTALSKIEQVMTDIKGELSRR